METLGMKLGREFVLQISKALHGNNLSFDDKLDLLGEVADYCEGKKVTTLCMLALGSIDEAWNEELTDDED